MAESLATTPIRYSLGADEHLFAEVSESMSLEAFFKGAVTRAVERLALDGVLDVCLANASFQIRFDPDRIAPEALLEAVRGAEAQAVAELAAQQFRDGQDPVHGGPDFVADIG